MAPRQQEAFVVSPSVTASRLLGLYLVARAIFMTKGHSEDSVQVIFSRFLNRLPSAIGPNFCYPSLAFFSKHWLDALPELQSGSRQLFLWTLHQMPEVKQALVRQYWCQHLPTCQHSKILSKTMCRATVIMAVMVCEYPTTFTLEATKEISTSLVLLMNEEDSTKSVYRLSSIELLGHGFVTWQPHLNTHQLVRTLVQLSIAVSNSPVAIKAKEALLLLGRTQVNLLVQTMVHDLDHGKASTDKILILKCLSFLVTQDPLILLSSLPRILESVIKSLDPTLPGTRDVLLQPTTVTLFEILKKYPSVCFHASHQRLCVGTMEGMIVIWDLKTATKLHLLEGHSRAVDAVAFSSDAKSIVSFSLQEQSIKLWQQSSGFMFFGNATLKFAKSLRHTSTTTNVLSLRLSLQDRTIEILDDVSRETYPY
ncbi:hypothetical protein HMI54_011024 [Coelomomyces lativittatus]|nr:hypothetical protein HMI54_011024 [Coelomomyces lativittatus]